MLINKNIKNIFFYFLILFFLTEETLAEKEYYKCPEKINTVLSGESQYIAAGSIIGVNYVKLSGLSSPFTNVTIKFKEPDSKNPAKKIINNKRLNDNSLGYG